MVGGTRRVVFAVALIVIPTSTVLTAARVDAQPTADKDKKKTAKSYVDAGLAAQNSGDYETALQFYSKAYELVPHPVLLFNMAQAHRLAGRPKQALDLYQQYVAADPNGPESKTAREFIIALQNQLAAEDAKKANEAQAAKAAEAAKAEQARKAQEANKVNGTHTPVAEVQPTQPESKESSDTSSASSPGKTLRIVGLVGVGAGAVSIGVGVYFGLQARSLSDELSQHNAAYTAQKEADGKAADRNLIIFTAVGSALAIGGGVAYWIGHKHGASSGVAVAPTWNSGPGIGIGGSL